MKATFYIWSLTVALLCCTAAPLKAQGIAVKSDLLTGLLSSPNIGMEVRLSRRFTLEAALHYNPFSADTGRRWKHWWVQPELRYWMCQPFGGHFVGVHLMYGVYNVGNVKLPFGLLEGTRTLRYEGDFAGAGLSYGYHFILSPRWSIETSVGLGFVHTTYDRYRCLHCGEGIGRGHRNFAMPTKAAVSLVYIIR